MINEPATEIESDDATTDSTTPSTTAFHPWVSYLSIIACISISLGLAAQNDYESWDTLAKFGYLPADSIWNGGYWAFVTSAFVHFTLWHVAFNVYWLWVLGSRLEQAIGSLRFLAFFVVSAIVTSSLQLAVSDATGIRASGVVYAIFGFMWATRHRYPQFNEVLDARTIQIFIIWLVGCVVATFLDVWDVGNAAHISGLLFGAAVAGAFVLQLNRRLMFGALVTLVVLSIVPLFWCPWSITWLSYKAYNAHASERYAAALTRYTQIINLDPENAWAYLNRSFVHEALGRPEEAQADLQKSSRN